MYRFLFIAVFILFLSQACQDAKPQSSSGPDIAEMADREQSLPSIPIQILEKIYQDCQAIDLTFYTSPISASYDNPNAIRALVSWVASDVPDIDPSCRPNGRLDFIVDGALYMDAELFLQDQCTYFIFRENGEAKYANKLTASGIKTFNDIVHAASKQ